MPPHLLGKQCLFGIGEFVYLIDFRQRRAHRPQPNRKPAVFVHDVGERSHMLDARCGVAVEQVRKALTEQGEQIDRGRAGRGIGIVRVGPFGALVDVSNAVPVGVLEKIQIADFEPPGQIDPGLHSDRILL